MTLGRKRECRRRVARYPARLRSRAGPLPADRRCRGRRRRRGPRVRGRALSRAAGPRATPYPGPQRRRRRACGGAGRGRGRAGHGHAPHQRRGDGAGGAGFRVDAVAFQWGWQFSYPSRPGVVDRSAPGRPATLHVPAGTRSQVDLRTRDVVHASGSPICASSAMPGRARPRASTCASRRARGRRRPLRAVLRPEPLRHGLHRRRHGSGALRGLVAGARAGARERDGRTAVRAGPRPRRAGGRAPTTRASPCAWAPPPSASSWPAASSRCSCAPSSRSRGCRSSRAAATTQLFTMHGSTMIYLFVTPVALALGIYFVPLQVGAAGDRVAARWTCAGFWLLVLGGLIMWSGFLTRGGAGVGGVDRPSTRCRAAVNTPGTGHGPVDRRASLLATLAAIAAGGLPARDHRRARRAPGMTLLRMPVFTWTMLVTCLMMVVAFPALVLAMALLLARPPRRRRLRLGRRARRPTSTCSGSTGTRSST